MKVIGIIPARYASTRFPGKPLALLDNKPVVQWVYEKAKKVLENVCVATDDERIFTKVKDFGGTVVMTSPEHGSGTDRCAEALGIMEAREGIKYEVVVNIQGDEPFIEPSVIKEIIDLFSDSRTEIATLATKISGSDDIFDPNKVKVVTDIDGFAMFFSRSPLPYIRDAEKNEWHKKFPFLKHFGIYAYLPEVLARISSLPQSRLEIAESLEQMRWLEHGFRIKVAVAEIEHTGIDTPADLQKAKTLLFNGKFLQG